jgi:cold shock CspA family protein
MYGTTLKWNRLKGYGFVLADDNTLPDVFVFAKCILGPKGRRFLMPGWRVEFDVEEVPEGLAAINLKILTKPIAMQYSATAETGGRS